jgi:hypothetical protein
MTTRATTRFPTFKTGDGGYESYFLRAVSPDRTQAIWLRHTIHKSPGKPPVGSIWLTLFDGESEAPLARKQSFGDPAAPDGGYLVIAGSTFSPTGVRGGFGDATYDIAFSGDGEGFRHLPRDWMYRAPLPKTKLETPHPAITLEGEVTAGDTTLDVGGWLGTVGHNWGSQHAERWIFLHGAAFADLPEAWVDLAIGRVRIGRFVTPWVANGMLSVAGRRHRLGGPLGRPQVDEDALRVDFDLRGTGLALKGSVHSPRAQTVVYRYADPGGHEHHVAHCSLASMDLVLTPDGQVPLRMSTRHGGCYELGMGETDHGLPVQPFPDP